MKAVLNRSLVRHLVLQGYKYCLSKTINIQKQNASVQITLTPTRSRPTTRLLPPGYDTYFSIMHEPLQMADGIDDTEVLINLHDTDIERYRGSVSFI
ncbi:hypothetical protein DYU05_15410 [Mucilaginibacter terrenus]|uniref:Uncharacterized protein n=1 Tax=Mucilaginibacter terrenus TaxID=2482727 RepID=A0A3E2NLZ5_9SPHI|nr:hypothetical protein [Mucilaginibacter terrenus]RFZ82016.1 hypothetical protein DYU05_15410 [Mucilaginibacter terrenus]